MSANPISMNIGAQEMQIIVAYTEPVLELGLRHLYSDISIWSKHIVALDIVEGGDGIELLKIATEINCLLVQLPRFAGNSLPSAVQRFFQLPGVSFVGVGIKYSVDALRKRYGIGCRNVTDLGSLAAAVKRDQRFEALGVHYLARSLCGICPIGLSTELAFGDWGKGTLSHGQIEAAASDVFCAFKIGVELLSGLEVKNVEVDYGFW